MPVRSVRELLREIAAGGVLVRYGHGEIDAATDWREYGLRWRDGRRRSVDAGIAIAAHRRGLVTLRTSRLELEPACSCVTRDNEICCRLESWREAYARSPAAVAERSIAELEPVCRLRNPASSALLGDDAEARALQADARELSQTPTETFVANNPRGAALELDRRAEELARLYWLVANGERVFGSIWREASAADIDAARRPAT